VLTITSKGPGAAHGVRVNDTLPTKAGLSWSIDAANSDAGWTISSGVLNFGGASGVTMALGASSHVHITSPTTAATCGAVNNTGNADTSNDGTDTASASVTVNCPDVKVTKTPDGGTINAGETATFSIKVENIGAGTAKAVTLHDALPGTPRSTGPSRRPTAPSPAPTAPRSSTAPWATSPRRRPRRTP